MIDLSLLRKNPEHIISLIKRKDPAFDAEALVDLDKQLRALRIVVEDLRHKKNELAQQAKGGITPALREESIAIGKALKEKETALRGIEESFNQLYLSCPNIPLEDVPVGDKSENVVVEEYGEKPSFAFDVKNHVELGQALGWFDFEAAAKMTKGNFALYKAEAVRLMYALTMFMIEHNASYGYDLILPPYLVNAQSLLVASNFPKFKDDVFAIEDEDLYLSPTAEVQLTNLYRDHIFSKRDLPVRLTAWTSCFRKEAGGYGAQERGLIRIHQFEKVELYTFCLPENATKEQERMLTCVKSLLDALGLHYRVSLLATQDCSFPSAKTFDVEVWLPGQGEFYEVSSVSQCGDFQARRGKIRYKDEKTKKINLVNTINGSCLALPRLIVALMETYQQKDGSIALPEVLRRYGPRV